MVKYILDDSFQIFNEILKTEKNTKVFLSDFSNIQ